MDDTVVSAAWLADHRDEVRVVDVRDPWEYEGIGHVSGAVSVPFDEFRSEDGDEGMLPGERRWADLLGNAGIGADDRVVAYDDDHGVFAARFLVTALLYGHDPSKLALLDGDYTAWMRGHETAMEPPDVSPATYEPREPADSPLVSAAAVAGAVDSDAVVVDTRSPPEFAEGHIPGAVNVDWRELVDEESRGLLRDEELRAVLAEKGIEPGRRVVLYCNTARRISHTYVVLRHLGFEGVEFYEGSLTEWEAEGREIVEED